jgi:hypothetical protein
MKNYRFLLAAIFGFALIFTFSCSDDKSDGGNEQSSNSRPNSSSSSSKAVVQEYCVLNSTSTGSGLCGVIEPIGSTRGCPKGTKSDYCPYGYSKMNLDLLTTCVTSCSTLKNTCGRNCTNLKNICERCGGELKTNSNGDYWCPVRNTFCN